MNVINIKPLYYQALSSFRGTRDMFFQQQIYTTPHIESNGFKVERLMKKGKIKIWVKNDSE